MDEIIEIAAVAVASFVSTSTDNLILLAVLLGQRGQRRMPVMVGYSLAGMVIAVAGLLIARAADVVPTGWLGYLGAIPITMGGVRLVRALKLSPDSSSIPIERQVLSVTAVTLLMLANSSDTLAVFASLFAETSEPFTYVIAGTVVLSSVCWFGLALVIGRNPWMRSGIARLERWLVPLLLIGIGLYILSDTATDTV